MSDLHIPKIIIKDDNIPLLTETKISQTGIEKNGDDISFNRLIALKTVLASVDLPPDPTTLFIDHRIILEDTTNTQTTCDLRNDYFIINDSINNNYYSFNSDTLQVDNALNPSYIRMNAYDGLKIQNDTKSGAPTSTNTFTHSNISIDNVLGGGPTNTLTAGDVTINDNGSTMVSQLTSDFITLSIPSSSITSALTANNLSISDGNLSTNNLIGNKQILLTDNASNIQTEISNDVNINAEPFIRMQDSTGLNNYYNRSSINADGHNCFTLENNEKFFKQNNPFSFKRTELFDGEYIEKNMPFVFTQDVSVLKLRNYTEYLDDNGDIGWNCIISNYSGFSMDIDTDGLRWYSHSSGLSIPPIAIKKYSTCMITLVYSSIDNEYLWAVSMF